MDKDSAEPQAEHSPTPFHVRPSAAGFGEYIIAANHEAIAQMMGYSIVDVDAAFIVRACNAYDDNAYADLRAALIVLTAAARGMFESSPPWDWLENAIAYADAALARTRGEAVQA